MNAAEEMLLESVREELKDRQEDAVKYHQLQAALPAIVRDSTIEATQQILDEADDLDEAQELLDALEGSA